MLTGDLVDTVMNLTTFAFIGAMIRLYLRRPAEWRAVEAATEEPDPRGER